MTNHWADKKTPNFPMTNYQADIQFPHNQPLCLHPVFPWPTSISPITNKDIQNSSVSPLADTQTSSSPITNYLADTQTPVPTLQTTWLTPRHPGVQWPNTSWHPDTQFPNDQELVDTQTPSSSMKNSWAYTQSDDVCLNHLNLETPSLPMTNH